MELLVDTPEGMSVNQMIGNMECVGKPTTYQMAKIIGVMAAEGDVDRIIARPRRYTVHADTRADFACALSSTATLSAEGAE